VTRPPDQLLKIRLLDGVVEYLAEHGLPDFSLRPLAKALGCSTTSLVYHLGSREEILTSAFRRAAEIQVEIRRGWLVDEPDMSQSDLLRKWWEWMNESGANLAIMRLGLEAAALEATSSGLESSVRSEQIGQWRLNIEHRLIANGLSPAVARVEATLAKAVYTGLVLDLIATGERDRLTEALEAALARLDRAIAEATCSAAIEAAVGD
jgi:AcrR family transcriptional regulator